jgi:mono/diheme cytochrome c family protein
VGVQAKPTNDTKAFSFFLANYVIESDSTLGNFRGSGIGKPFDNGDNTLYRGQRVSMGGCQGCHGVAQTNLGTDFSFLLDSVGKPVQNPDANGDKTKLLRLITATQTKK